jgi:putative Mg2+ transporter-C (MgtC) family protein
MSTHEILMKYWSAAEITTNLIIFLNLLGALLLGLLVGYERSYRGRAAGMRTYGLVCMASAALTVLAGYPTFWYGGQVAMTTAADPTRIIQGIVTGIGFLGAGVIMKEGFTISGLTTAASIWASSAIGVLVGVGFYAAAMLLALMSAASMLWIARLENWLPSRQAVAITLRFRRDFMPREETLRQAASDRGYDIATGSLSISFHEGQSEWQFVAVAFGKGKVASVPELAQELALFEGVEHYQLSHARN